MKSGLVIKNIYTFSVRAPSEKNLAKYLALRDQYFETFDPYIKDRMYNMLNLVDERHIHNLVPTVCLNDMLDKYWAGSSYTAAWYLGLVAQTGFTAFSLADTMASHAGWSEMTDYSQSTRGALTFGSSASGDKSTSTPVTLSMNPSSSTFLTGAFVTSNNTKGGATGTLASEGAFIEGDLQVNNGFTLEVSYTSHIENGVVQ